MNAGTLVAPKTDIATRQQTGMVAIEQQRAAAEVQAAMMIARTNPRDEVHARDLILQDCTNPRLADAATYDYARGGTSIIGPSVRLAETMARRWGNLECGVKELSRGAGYSECMAYAVDLQTGFRDVKTFQVKHWRDTKAGGYPITDERDIYELTANMGARRKRACILAILPTDLVDEAVAQCEVTLTTKAEVTPERLAGLVEKFAVLGVSKEQIEKRIQRRLDAMTPALMVQLGKIYNSIRDEMSKPADWFESPAQAESEAQAAPKAGVAGAKAALKAKRKQAEPAAAAPAQAPASATQAKPKGTAEEKQKFLDAFKRTYDGEVLSLLADDARAYDWDPADGVEMTAAYHARMEQLGA